MNGITVGQVELMESAAKNDSFPPAFIFGVPRSGTTLLVNLLGSHPLVAPLYETRFLRNLVRFCARASWLGRGSLPSRLERFFGTSVGERLFLRECESFENKATAYHSDSPSMCIRYTAEELARETEAWLQAVRRRSFSGDEIYRSAREFVNRLFAIHCRRMNKPYWINKTPGLLNHLEGLARLYPEAKCIHIIRDGRDVAVSNLGQKWGPSNVHEAARRWKSLMREGRKALDKKKLTFIEIRYENLIRSPETSLQEIFAFLNLQGAPGEILARIKVHDRSIGAWRTGFTAKDRTIFARAAGDLLIDLGYETNDSWST
jgi:hypothetical protein